VPVPFELLDFTLGRLRIRATNELGQPTGEFYEADPLRYIVHRGHLLPVPDSWGGPFRSLVFWWFFRSMGRGSWARFLERYGSPFLVGKYDLNDDDSRSVLERAFSRAAQLFGIVITRETEVEIQQAGAKDSGEAFEAFHATANKEMSKLILGQTSSAEAQKTGGIGDGPSDQHETVRQDIRQFDATQLARTLVDQLAVQLLAINGQPGVVTLTFGGESGEEATETATLLKLLKEAGFQVTDMGLPLLAKRLALPIERVAPPPAPTLPPAMPPGTPPGKMEALSLPLLALAAQALSANALDRMPGDAPAGLARRFRAGAAPLRDLIDRASSPEEVLAGVRALSIGWEDGATADLLTETLLTYAANGSLAPS
jgi:phage gp29-like protein